MSGIMSPMQAIYNTLNWMGSAMPADRITQLD